jgi:hypothetical protein
MSKTFWTCLNCHEEVESRFEVCWNCQRDRTGVVPPNFSDLEIEDRAEKTFLNARTSDKYCLACQAILEYVAMRTLVIGLIASSLIANTWLVAAAPAPTQAFDQYGAISWNDEMARLDNFAIQLQNYPNSIGFIVTVDADRGCPGEAKARAMRAKRYIVEHRGIPWNRVAWRVDGHDSDIRTSLWVVPIGVSLSYPFRGPSLGKDGPLTKKCQTRLRQIARSRWPSP